jgi:hypothetical protein
MPPCPTNFRFFVVSFIPRPALLVARSGVQKVSHNLLAVYDVLPARIRACVARPRLAKCAEVSRGKERGD